MGGGFHRVVISAEINIVRNCAARCSRSPTQQRAAGVGVDVFVAIDRAGRIVRAGGVLRCQSRSRVDDGILMVTDGEVFVSAAKTIVVTSLVAVTSELHKSQRARRRYLWRGWFVDRLSITSVPFRKTSIGPSVPATSASQWLW